MIIESECQLIICNISCGYRYIHNGSVVMATVGCGLCLMILLVMNSIGQKIRRESGEWWQWKWLHGGDNSYSDGGSRKKNCSLDSSHL